MLRLTLLFTLVRRLSACWEENGDDRPDFVEVQQILGKMRAELDSSASSSQLYREEAGSIHRTAH